ncbi:MAG TPA: ATP-binding cassette domain-containing protein, partial [Jatrophihabitans sp.]|nr:ATP-binding cassette domain-containing protein [Jatrophihabitans sp.]
MTAVDGVDLSIGRPGLYAIVGKSGSGKSTLLQLLAGLDRPTFGSVTYRGSNLAKLSEQQRTQLRRSDFGFVFQRFNLIPTLCGRDNVTLPTTLAGGKLDHSKVDELFGWL